jgi:hypothetical protein
MENQESVTEMRKKVETLAVLAQQLCEESEDFPGVNRNGKRILASVQMLKINLEEV